MESKIIVERQEHKLRTGLVSDNDIIFAQKLIADGVLYIHYTAQVLPNSYNYFKQCEHLIYDRINNPNQIRIRVDRAKYAPHACARKWNVDCKDLDQARQYRDELNAHIINNNSANISI